MNPESAEAKSRKRTAPVLIQEGLAHFDAHDFKKAIEAFSRARKLTPNPSAAAFFLSLSYFAQQNLEAAKTTLGEGLKISPENVLGQNIRALLAFREGKPREALSILNLFGCMEHPRIQAFLLFEIENQLLEEEQ